MSDLNLDFKAATRGEKAPGWKEFLSGKKTSASSWFFNEWATNTTFAENYPAYETHHGYIDTAGIQTVDVQFQQETINADRILNQWMRVNQEAAQPTRTDVAFQHQNFGEYVGAQDNTQRVLDEARQQAEANRLPDDAHIERLIARIEAERDLQNLRAQARADDQWRVIWNEPPIIYQGI